MKKFKEILVQKNNYRFTPIRIPRNSKQIIMKNAKNFFKAWQENNPVKMLKYSQDSSKADIKLLFKGLNLSSFEFGEVVDLGDKCKGINVKAVVNDKEVNIKAIYIEENGIWGINPVSVLRLDK